MKTTIADAHMILTDVLREVREGRIGVTKAESIAKLVGLMLKITKLQREYAAARASGVAELYIPFLEGGVLPGIDGLVPVYRELRRELRAKRRA